MGKELSEREADGWVTQPSRSAMPHENELAKMVVLAARIGGGQVLVRRPMVLGPQGYFARVVRTRTLSVAAIGRPTVWSSLRTVRANANAQGALWNVTISTRLLR
jgi:hypothetical protein